MIVRGIMRRKCRTSLYFFVLFAASLELLRRKRHTIPLFSSFIRSARVRGPSPGPLTTPCSRGCTPCPRLTCCPRSVDLFRSLEDSYAAQIYSRGKGTVPNEGEGALIGCLLQLIAVPQKVIASVLKRGNKTTAPCMVKRAQQSAHTLGNYG